MRYIAALDYQHLDNGIFLTSLARSISQQQNMRPVIVHGDSAYTERIMQTGVIRDEAKVRSIKDLNHRLIAMFADQGISAIGLNGYQRKFITTDKDTLALDHSFWQGLPSQSVLLLSTLVWDKQTEKPLPVRLPKMVTFLQQQLKAEAIFAFSSAEKDEILIQKKQEHLSWNNLPDGFVKEHVPEEFQQFAKPLRLTTARDFHNPAAPENSILIS